MAGLISQMFAGLGGISSTQIEGVFNLVAKEEREGEATRRETNLPGAAALQKAIQRHRPHWVKLFPTGQK